MENRVNKSSSSRIIKKLAKSQKNIKNLAKFKNHKNSTEYKKLIRNLVKFEIFESSSFLNSATKLAYTWLR